MQKAHPGWGPLTILKELENDQRFRGKKFPSRSRLAAFSKQEKLTRPYERHSQLPGPGLAHLHLTLFGTFVIFRDYDAFILERSIITSTNNTYF